jgi:predicted glycoside hydrolase/deacetylase ChbG (UPF0249 family)
MANKIENGIRLIVNADDFGLSRGITDGILRAHTHGIVTSTSMMVNQSASEYAAFVCQSFPKLDLGIHLTISEGRPILPPHQVPSLVNREGQFFAREELARRLSRWQVSSAEIKAEFLAQIRWMKGHDIIPSHADSHHRTHVYPASLIAYRAALLEENICRSRSPRSSSFARAGYLNASYAGSARRRIMVGLYMELVCRTALRPFTLPQRSVVPHPSYRTAQGCIADGWVDLLEHLPGGLYELGCHPGLPEVGFTEHDEFGKRRGLELEALTSPVLRSIIDRREIELIRFSEI